MKKVTDTDPGLVRLPLYVMRDGKLYRPVALCPECMAKIRANRPIDPGSLPQGTIQGGGKDAADRNAGNV